MLAFTIVGLLAWLPAARLYILARRMASARLHWMLTITPVVIGVLVTGSFAWWALVFSLPIAVANLALGGYIAVLGTLMLWGHAWLLRRYAR